MTDSPANGPPSIAVHASELFAEGAIVGRVLEELDIWLNVHDAELNMLFWNRVAERLSGYRSEDVLGHREVWVWCYPDPALRQAIFDKADHMIAEGAPVSHFRNEIVCRDGSRRSMSWNSQPWVGQDGRIEGAIVAGYDITEMQRSRAALEQANEDLAVLYDVASVTSRPLELGLVLGQCLERVLGALGGDGGTVHLQAPGHGDLHLAAHAGTSAEQREVLDRAVPGKGLVGRVFDSGQPLVVEDVSVHPWASAAARSLGVGAYAGVPIRAKGETLGVLSLIRRDGGTRREHEPVLLASIGDHVGLAVENARLRSQAEQLAVLEERGRLARDLHDSVTQSLYSQTLFAEAGRRLLEQGDYGRAGDYLDRLAETAQHTLKEMRLLVYELRPVELERDGLLGALSRRLSSVEQRSGVVFSLDADPELSLPPEIEETFYRLAQEALNNALKHSHARRVRVAVRALDGQASLNIEDDGEGFDPQQLSDSGIGMSSMRERVERLGGALAIRSAAGSGTRVEVRVPLPSQEDAR